MHHKRKSVPYIIGWTKDVHCRGKCTRFVNERFLIPVASLWCNRTLRQRCIPASYKLPRNAYEFLVTVGWKRKKTENTFKQNQLFVTRKIKSNGLKYSTNAPPGRFINVFLR